MAIDLNIDKILHLIKEYTDGVNTPIRELKKVNANDPFKILISTILSARTQDKVTVLVCERLFTKASNIYDLLNLTLEDIEEILYPIGFYKLKSKRLYDLPRTLISTFNGEIPQTFEELTKLPGVGRKTANLILTQVFDLPAICVDTHVHRISNRIGYIETKNVGESENALREKLNQNYWKSYNTLLVAFGQSVCRPIRPKCLICPISEYCKLFYKYQRSQSNNLK
jgi:endonuclease III